MNIYLRMTKSLYDEVMADMRRVHPVAAERIGFLHARLGHVSESEQVLVFIGYTPVKDDHYVDDPASGGRINGDAIREAMQRILDDKCGLFHVHRHERSAVPSLSKMDRDEIPRLVQSFRHTDPKSPHGIFLLGIESFACWAWLPKMDKPINPVKATIVGYPLAFVKQPEP